MSSILLRRLFSCCSNSAAQRPLMETKKRNLLQDAFDRACLSPGVTPEQIVAKLVPALSRIITQYTKSNPAKAAPWIVRVDDDTACCCAVALSTAIPIFSLCDVLHALQLFSPRPLPCLFLFAYVVSSFSTTTDAVEVFVNKMFRVVVPYFQVNKLAEKKTAVPRPCVRSNIVPPSTPRAALDCGKVVTYNVSKTFLAQCAKQDHVRNCPNKTACAAFDCLDSAGNQRHPYARKGKGKANKLATQTRKRSASVEGDNASPAKTRKISEKQKVTTKASAVRAGDDEDEEEGSIDVITPELPEQQPVLDAPSNEKQEEDAEDFSMWNVLGDEDALIQKDVPLQDAQASTSDPMEITPDTNVPPLLAVGQDDEEAEMEMEKEKEVEAPVSVVPPLSEEIVSSFLAEPAPVGERLAIKNSIDLSVKELRPYLDTSGSFLRNTIQLADILEKTESRLETSPTGGLGVTYVYKAATQPKIEHFQKAGAVAGTIMVGDIPCTVTLAEKNGKNGPEPRLSLFEPATDADRAALCSFTALVNSTADLNKDSLAYMEKRMELFALALTLFGEPVLRLAFPGVQQATAAVTLETKQYQDLHEENKGLRQKLQVPFPLSPPS